MAVYGCYEQIARGISKDFIDLSAEWCCGGGSVYLVTFNARNLTINGDQVHGAQMISTVLKMVLPCATTVYARDDTGKGKLPHLKWALQQGQITSQETVLIDDNTKNVASAKDMFATVQVVGSGFSFSDLPMRPATNPGSYEASLLMTTTTSPAAVTLAATTTTTLAPFPVLAVSAAEVKVADAAASTPTNWWEAPIPSSLPVTDIASTQAPINWWESSPFPSLSSPLLSPPLPITPSVTAPIAAPASVGTTANPFDSPPSSPVMGEVATAIAQQMATQNQQIYMGFDDAFESFAAQSVSTPPPSQPTASTTPMQIASTPADNNFVLVSAPAPPVFVLPTNSASAPATTAVDDVKSISSSTNSNSTSCPNLLYSFVTTCEAGKMSRLGFAVGPKKNACVTVNGCADDHPRLYVDGVILYDTRADCLEAIISFCS